MALGITFIDDTDFGPGTAASQARAPNLARTAAGELTRNGWAVFSDSDSNSDDESFGILVFSGVRLAGRVGVQEEPSTPHARLAYIHLQNLLADPYRPMIAT